MADQGRAELSTNREELSTGREDHKPLPTQTQGRWRVHCSCGWKGPVVAMVGHGYGPWVEHFNEYIGPMSLEGMKR